MDHGDELGTWSRHFDTLLWQVTTMFAAAIGGLLAYSYSKFDQGVAIFGLLITPIPVYFAASFREVRFNIHQKLPQEVHEAIYMTARPNGSRGRKLHQWEVYVLLMVGLAALWARLLINNAQTSWWYWASLGLSAVVFAMIFWFYRLGNVDWNRANGSES